jgi:hypothetical protein
MKKINMLETFFRGLIREGLEPSLILTAFHNVCCHGEILEETGWNINDESLEKLFTGFDTSLTALRAMEQ